MAAQLPDFILHQGTKMDLYSNPLEPYWTLHRKKRPAFIPSKSCKRGYIATWEIRDKQLFLIHLDGKIERRSFLFWKKIVPYPLKKLFRKAGDRTVLANWFTGKLRIPQGNRTFYVHHEYDSRFESEMIITLERGNVVKTVIVDFSNQKLLTED